MDGSSSFLCETVVEWSKFCLAEDVACTWLACIDNLLQHNIFYFNFQHNTCTCIIFYIYCTLFPCVDRVIAIMLYFDLYFYFFLSSIVNTTLENLNIF